MSKHLAFETCGSESGPATLLVHGFFSSNLQWLRNRAALGESLRLVMVEIWGHGNSPTPRESDAYSADRYVAEIERIRRELSIEKLYLIGHSYGAGVLTQYALAFPGRVSGVVATNSMTAFGGFSPDIARRMLEVIETNPAALPMHPANSRSLQGQLRRQFVEAAARVDPYVARQTIAQHSTMSCVDRLADLEPPLLLINGTQETSFQPKVEHIRRTFDNVTVADVDAGHSPNLGQPAEFNRLVREFIRSH